MSAKRTSAFEDSHRTPPGSRVTGFLSGKQSRGKKRLSLFRKRTGSVIAPTRFVFLLDVFLLDLFLLDLFLLDLFLLDRRSLVFPI